MLNDPDAARYAVAVSNAMRHLPITVAQKAVDYAAFVMVAFSIESPRVVRSAQMAQAAKGRPPGPRGPAQVFEFTGGRDRAAGPPNGPGGAPGAAGGPSGDAAPSPFPAGPDGFGLTDEPDL